MDIPNEKKQIDLASAYYTKGRKLWSKGDRDNALELFRKALSIQESILGIYNKQTARTYYWVGYALNHRKEYSKALVAYRRTLRIRLFLLGEDDASTEDVKRALRDVLKEQGQDDVRIRTYLDTVAAAVEHEKNAIAFEERGEYIEAVEEYEKYLAIEEASVGNFPLDIARIHSKIADIHKMNHKQTMAISSYRRALSIFSSKLGQRHADSQHCISGIEVCATIKGLKASEVGEYMELVLESISLIRQGDDLKNSGSINEAMKRYEEALRIESLTIEIYPLTAAELHIDIARCHRQQKEFDLAIVMLRTALSVFVDEYGEHHPTVKSCLKEMASTLHEQDYGSADVDKYLGTVSYSVKCERSGESMRKEGDFAGAIAELQRSLELEVAALGKYHLTQVPSYKGIARSYDAQGQHSFASSSLRAALLICMTRLGLHHPKTQALFNEAYETAKREGCECTTVDAFVNLVSTSIQLQIAGNDQLEKGHYVKAYSSLHRAIAAQEEASGQYHICASDLYSNAAKALLHSGQCDRALKKYRELLVIHQSVFGRDHPSSQRALKGIGEALTSKRVKIEVANEYSNTVIESVSHELNGDNEIKQGLYDQAVISYERALRTERTLLGESCLTAAGILDKIASAYRLRGEHHRAILTCRKSIQVYQFFDEPEHGDIQHTLKNLGKSILALGFNMSAVERYQRGIQASIACETQGDAALLAGNSVKAISKYQKAIEIEEDVLGKLHPTTSSFYKKIADISRNEEDFESAVLFYSKALAIEESCLGKDNASTITTFNQLMNAAQKHGSKSGASLDGWNMLKYVLMGLIGLLVLIISVAKSMSTNQRTIKSLKIAAYDKADDFDDDNFDDKDGGDPKRPLEPPEERYRYSFRGGWSADSSSYETMSGGEFDKLPSDNEQSPSLSRRLADKSVGGANFKLDQSAILQPSLAQEEKARSSSGPSGTSMKEKTSGFDTMLKSKVPTRKEDDRTGIVRSLAEQKPRVQIPAVAPKPPLKQTADAKKKSPMTETKATTGNADEKLSPFSTKDGPRKIPTPEGKDDKKSVQKSSVPKIDEQIIVPIPEVKDVVEDSITKTTTSKEVVPPGKSTKDSHQGQEAKVAPELPQKESSVNDNKVKQSSVSDSQDNQPSVSDSQAKQSSPAEDQTGMPAASQPKEEDHKQPLSSDSNAVTWEKVLNSPILSADEAKGPTIDEKLKSQKSAKTKDGDDSRSSLSKMLQKWRKAADNEGGDAEEDETSGLDSRIKKWKQAADRASTRHLGA